MASLELVHSSMRTEPTNFDSIGGPVLPGSYLVGPCEFEGSMSTTYQWLHFYKFSNPWNVLKAYIDGVINPGLHVCTLQKVHSWPVVSLASKVRMELLRSPNCVVYETFPKVVKQQYNCKGSCVLPCGFVSHTFIAQDNTTFTARIRSPHRLGKSRLPHARKHFPMKLTLASR